MQNNETATTTRPKKRKPVIAALILLVLLALGWHYAPALVNKIKSGGENKTRTEDVAVRLEALERRVSELSGNLYQVQQKADQALNKANAPAGQTVPPALLEELGNRVKTLEEAPAAAAAVPVDVEALKNRITMLEQQIQSNRSNIEETSKIVEESTRTRSSLAIAAAYDRIQSSLRRGEPYAAAWESLARQTGTNETLKPLVDALAPYRESSVFTPEKLKTSFSSVIGNWQKAATATAPDAGAWDKVKANMGGLVTIRKVGDTAGNTDEAIIARAEAYLNKGDHTAALQELAKLSANAAPHFVEWQKNARAYLAANEALTKLQMAIWQNGEAAQP